jgi:alkyl sulfatase BDS1-like metallo-beta-lactamase superfamily hydrolase
VIEREALDQLVLKSADVPGLAESGRLRVEGDAAQLISLLALLEEPDPSFPIVTPRRGD